VCAQPNSSLSGGVRATAFDLLELITWSVNVLPHAATGPMQMTHTIGLACKPHAVVNLDNMDDVPRIVLKIQHNDQFRPTSNQTIVVPLGVPERVSARKHGSRAGWTHSKPEQ